MARRLIERLEHDAEQLQRMVDQAAFGGSMTGVRVKSPALLLADLREAVAALSTEADNKALREALNLVRQQVDDLSYSVNCNVDHILSTIDAALGVQHG